MELYQIKEDRKKRDQILLWVAAFLLAGGSFLEWQEWIGMEQFLLPLLAVAAGAGAAVLVRSVKHGWIAAAILFLFLFPAGCWLFETELMNGVAGLANRWIKVCWEKGIFQLSELKTDEITLHFDEQMILALLAFLTGFFVPVFVYGNSQKGFFFWILLWIFVAVWNIEAISLPVVLLFLAGAFLTWFLKSTDRGGGKTAFLLFLPGTAAALLILYLAAGSDAFIRQSAEPLSGAVQNLIQTARYGGRSANSLPKGDLSRLGDWEGSEDTALEVQMSVPGSYYLKGFTGGVYTGDAWEAETPSVYYEAKDLFYWLGKENFFTGTQLAEGEKLLSGEENTPDSSMKITVKKADREFCYLPYELSDSGSRFFAAGDYQLASEKLFGEKNYEFSLTENLVKKFPDLAAELYIQETEDAETALYEQLESYYNQFVYEQYLDIPDVARHTLKQELGPSEVKEKNHADYASAIRRIRKYLEAQITYSEYSEPISKGQDFLTDFLTSSKSGYCVHYAAAAALMFRYYGIPSRYVEGYLITPECASGADADGKVQVAGKDGHAWCEIYVDGLGWVPVEMTPVFYGVMEEPDFSRGIQSEQKEKQKNTGMSASSSTESEQQPDRKSQYMDLLWSVAAWILRFMELADILLILFFIGTLLRRCWKKRKWKKEFSQEDGKQAVRRMIFYTDRILLFISNERRELTKEERIRYLQKYYSQELAEKCRQAEAVGEKAMFSPHAISKEERKLVDDYRRELVRTVKKKQGWYEKWLMKYLECLG